MNDPSVALLQSVAAAEPVNQGVVLPAPDIATVAQFQALMNGQAPAQSAALPPGPVAIQAIDAGSPLNIGDRILAGLNQVGIGMKAHLIAVDAALAPGANIDALEILRIQRNMAEHSLEVELLSKTIGDVDRAINDLSKLQ